MKIHDRHEPHSAHQLRPAIEQLPKRDRAIIRQVGLLANKYYSAPNTPMLDTVICMGVVEFLEGKARPLSIFGDRHLSARPSHANEDRHQPIA